jgi:hypothetical protein
MEKTLKQLTNKDVIQYYLTNTIIVLALFDLANHVVYKDSFIKVLNIIVAYISLVGILYLIIKDINGLNKLNNKLNIGLNPTLLFICIYDINLIINILVNVTVINIIHYVIVITFTSYYIYQNYKKNKFEKN